MSLREVEIVKNLNSEAPESSLIKKGLPPLILLLCTKPKREATLKMQDDVTEKSKTAASPRFFFPKKAMRVGGENKLASREIEPVNVALKEPLSYGAKKGGQNKQVLRKCILKKTSSSSEEGRAG